MDSVLRHNMEVVEEVKEHNKNFRKARNPKVKQALDVAAAIYAEAKRTGVVDKKGNIVNIWEYNRLRHRVISRFK